jgi:hypothetical protein
MRRKYTIGIWTGGVLAAALAYFYLGGAPPVGQAPLRHLTMGNYTEFTNAFNAAKNQVRVVLLLSPT